MKTVARAGLLGVSLMLAACAARQPTVSGSLVRFSETPSSAIPFRYRFDDSAATSVEAFEAQLRQQRVETRDVEPVLSRGDRIRVLVENGQSFSGIFELGQAGTIDLPYLTPIVAAGMTLNAVGHSIERRLVQDGHFQPGRARVSVQPRYWAPLNIPVSGAVFDPGVVRLSGRTAEERKSYDEVSSGDAGADRTIANALRAAGGIRPDADLGAVLLVRGEQVRRIDLRGAITGQLLQRAFIADGDRVVVLSTGRINAELASPSQLTPPGIRVFLSNLTLPADSNTESAVNEHATKLPYGSRLSHALFSSNCIGGTKSVNAGRVAVLVGRNVVSSELQFMEVPVEEVIRNPASAVLNPVLLPNDSVGCYDSRVWNLRDLARTASDILNPLKMLSDAVRGPRY